MATRTNMLRDKYTLPVFYSIWLLIISIVSCSSGETVDEIINRLDHKDLGELEGLNIYYRSSGHSRNSSIFFLNSQEVDCSPYAIEVNNIERKIVKIRNNMAHQTCKEDYLSEADITKAVIFFLSLELPFVKVDSSRNVYINPFSPDTIPLLLRKAPNSDPEYFSQYKHYKGSWYIRL